ncbi:family 1 glycosylhydrolase [Mucilaginibacter jinjuensis]|uniref:Family 1 glycosylhydrolase n=1 Tax=Mucilaginibacter jinjuensis TaxID=1176721 RepID=A0ABY7TEH1_9SPHI|nr:family 1 glycosylhydrolase [Mucilaginibacter jinjuensis]WCT14924.1 family 1 glycosylhydrolase [Mucilaginibacter jinjuensis]
MRLQPEQQVEIWGGMECTINRVNDEYFDQLSYSGHRTREGDIDLFAGLGLKKMRYPVLWEKHQPVKSEPIDWQETESRLLSMRFNDIDIIAGLVHHGSGPAFVNMCDDSFAEGLAQYAGEVAQKFPWINYYTPVNEPLTTARFCGLYGLWYPHQKNDVSFCRILVNECKATILAMAAIRMYNPNAKLVQTDDMGKIHSTPALAYQAVFENERRWLSYDLLCGKVNPEHILWDYLIEQGITTAELEFFTHNACPPDIIGINYYLTSERYIDEGKDDYPLHTHGGNGKQTYADVEVVRVGKVRPDGLKKILKETWMRYQIPIAVTEVHLHCTRDEQMRWLKQTWDTANILRNENVPILAITPWALLGSFGWDRLLTQRSGTYESGVFDLSGGYPRPTILANMIRAYSKGERFDHPAIYSPGWWETACRVVYGVDSFFVQPTPPGKLLIISGTHSSLLSKICGIRGLNYIDTTGSETEPIVDAAIWASIQVNEYMEINSVRQADLIISLNGDDLYRSLNAGLDLFIDGESGNWRTTGNGALHKEIPALLPVHHFLVG